MIGLDRWQRMARRRAERAGVPVVDVTRAEVWAASNGRCQCADCGRHKGRCTATFGVGDKWHADHVIPLAPPAPGIPKGPHTPGNLRALCVPCNQAKSNRVTTLPEGPMRRALVTVALAARLRHPAVNVAAVPLPPISAPHLTTYRLALPPGKASVTTALAAEVRAALQSPRARVYGHGGELRAEVPRRMRAPVPLSAMPVGGLKIGVGVGPDNRIRSIDLHAAPHVLIAGATGSGKSVMLRTLARGLALAGARLALVDSDADTWAPFSGCAALEWAVAETGEDAAATVAAVQAAMDARKPGGGYAPLALLIDEAQILDAPTLAAVRDIARRGRKRAVHLILATQYVRSDILDRVLTGQCGWRIAGRLQDHTASKLALGVSGAELLGGAGDMLIAHGGRVTRVQAALGTGADFASLPQAIHAPEAAPRADQQGGRKWTRKDDTEAVAWAVERAQAEGVQPSASAIQRMFGGATDAARRQRDTALKTLAAS